MFTELLGRILDLDVEEYGPGDTKMVITVFHYATFFLSQGRSVPSRKDGGGRGVSAIQKRNCRGEANIVLREVKIEVGGGGGGVLPEMKSWSCMCVNILSISLAISCFHLQWNIEMYERGCTGM